MSAINVKDSVYSEQPMLTQSNEAGVYEFNFLMPDGLFGKLEVGAHFAMLDGEEYEVIELSTKKSGLCRKVGQGI